MQIIDLNPQIITRLKHDFEMTEQGAYLRGRCPDCEKKSLWTWLNKPGHVQCDRVNKCNFESTTKELFPDLFEKINEKYQPTAENPHATADAYLSLIRGFDLASVAGWYEQGSYYHPRGDKGTASVRFYLNAEKTVMWERLIEDVIITHEDGDRESRNKSFKGSFKGMWWQAPKLIINTGDEVWLCEGILDAIALNLNGIKAVAIMSSGTFPSEAIKPYLRKDITWVIATDNDTAGRAALHKHSKTLKEMGEVVTAALSSGNEAKSDWNDLHKAGKLTEKDINQYRYLGRIELTTSYREKAQMIWEHKNNRHYFIMSFKNRTYAVSVDKAVHEKAVQIYLAGADGSGLTSDDIKKMLAEFTHEQILDLNDHAFGQASKIREIATFNMDYLYFQQPDNGEDGQYFFRFVLANHGQERQIAFTHKTISAASDFKKSAMRIPGAQFTGSTTDLDWLYNDWTRYNTKEVRTLDFVGYDKASKTYVFNNFAVESGRIHTLNKQSFFQLKKQGIKTTVDIKQTLSEKNNSEWVHDFKIAFGIKGIVALSWWFGCLFVEQVREQHRSYPFFELVGEAASGKSSLVDFMWKLYGKEGESFNPNSSTLAGRTRKMAEVANFPVVFNETDNEDENNHVKRFNWDEQKDLYDGEFGRVTGIKSQDNSTKKPAFKAGLMIVQNIPVIASEAIMTRICHLNFDTSHHTPAGYDAAVRLNSLPISSVNGFVLHATSQADRVLKHFNKQITKHRAALQANPAIKLQRIIENHSKLMAMTDCLHGLFPEITTHDVREAQQYIEKMAATRQLSLNEDSQLIQQFWAQFDYLDSKPNHPASVVEVQHQMNHDTNPDRMISVNLEHFHAMCKLHHVPIIDPKELRKQLPSSKKRQYVENKTVRSRIENRSVRCWIFKR